MRRVYFIKPIGLAGPIKIGCSQSPDGRRETLANWSPFALEILATIEGGEHLERRFHAAFKHLHMRREWFAPALELTRAIEAIKAGTFDTESLPEPQRITGLGKGRNPRKRTADERYRYSAMARFRHVGISWHKLFPLLANVTGRGADIRLKHRHQIEPLIESLGGNKSPIDWDEVERAA